MVELTTTYFSQNSHCKFSEFSHAVCTNAFTAYIHFTKFNCACEVLQMANKFVRHFHRGAQVKCYKTLVSHRHNFFGWRVAYHRVRGICIFKLILTQEPFRLWNLFLLAAVHGLLVYLALVYQLYSILWEVVGWGGAENWKRCVIHGCTIIVVLLKELMMVQIWSSSCEVWCYTVSRVRIASCWWHRSVNCELFVIDVIVSVNCELFVIGVVVSVNCESFVIGVVVSVNCESLLVL